MHVSLTFLNLHDAIGAVQTLVDFLQPHCGDTKRVVQVQPTHNTFFTRFEDRRQSHQKMESAMFLQFSNPVSDSQLTAKPLLGGENS